MADDSYIPPPNFPELLRYTSQRAVDDAAHAESIERIRQGRKELWRTEARKPVPTLKESLANHHGPKWVWANCGNVECARSRALPLAPIAIRWGWDASTDRLRRSLLCRKCGSRGGAITIPGSSNGLIDEFPTSRAAQPWEDVMCNRYRRLRTFSDFNEEFSETRLRLVFPTVAPNFLGPEEVAPTDPAPIFRNRAAGNGLEMVLARWWLVPAHWKAPFKVFTKKAATFNARVETAATLPTFRQAWKFGRCLIPTDGWFEYTGSAKAKERWLIERQDGKSLMLAGLCSRYEDPEEGPTETFTMVMQPAYEQVRQIHHRAPIPLLQDQWENWLDAAKPVEPIVGASHTVPLLVARG